MENLSSNNIKLDRVQTFMTTNKKYPYMTYDDETKIIHVFFVDTAPDSYFMSILLEDDRARTPITAFIDIDDDNKPLGLELKLPKDYDPS